MNRADMTFSRMKKIISILSSFFVNLFIFRISIAINIYAILLSSILSQQFMSTI